MAEAARERGYEYLAITDHSASHGFGNHVTAEQLAARIEEIREWNKGKRKGSACSRAPRSTSSPTARSTTPTSCSPSSTG